MIKTRPYDILIRAAFFINCPSGKENYVLSFGTKRAVITHI